MKENTLIVKTISTNIFRYVNNYIVDKHHGLREEDVFINGSQNIFLKWKSKLNRLLNDIRRNSFLKQKNDMFLFQ